MYDVLIIGGGPGSTSQLNGPDRLVLKSFYSKNSLGGVCLNEGCIPSKALLNSSKLYSHAKIAAFGVTSENVSFDQSKVVKRKRKLSESWSQA